MKKTIVVMMAHADDIELNAGGTLAKYIAKGYKALYGVITRCNSGWNENEKEGGNYKPSVVIMPKRRAEAEAAAKAFGAEFYFGTSLENCYTQKDGVRVMPSFTGVGTGAPKDDILAGQPVIVAAGAGYSEPAAQQVEMADLLTKWEPEITICQFFHRDWNPDHYAAALLLLKSWMMASEKKKLGKFWIPVRLKGKDWPDFPPMKPNHHEDVTGFEETALKALACHVSQGMAMPNWQEFRRKRWAELGEKYGCKSAEVFARIGPWRKKKD